MLGGCLQTARRISDQIARSADQALSARVKLLQWWAFLVLVFLFGSGLTGSYFLGYRFGSDSGQALAEARIHETEAKLQAAFSHGETDADLWWTVMQSNDISLALRQCTRIATGTGRLACSVPLWIDPPTPSLPPAATPLWIEKPQPGNPGRP